MTDNLKLRVKIKRMALSRYKKYKTDSLWNDYKSLRNQVNISVRTKKKAFLQSATDPKRFWRTLQYLNLHNTKSTSTMPL